MANVTISEDLRLMIIPKTEKIIGCVGDHNVRSVHFNMPKYCDDTDLSEFRIQVHYHNAKDIQNYYEVTDNRVEDDRILFTWLVDKYACEYSGTVQANIMIFSDDKSNVFNSGVGLFKVKPAFESGPYGAYVITDAGDLIGFTEDQLEEDLNVVFPVIPYEEV